jgi:hypothetical protein
MATTLARVLPFIIYVRVIYVRPRRNTDRVKLVPYEESTGVLEQRTCAWKLGVARTHASFTSVYSVLSYNTLLLGNSRDLLTDAVTHAEHLTATKPGSSQRRPASRNVLLHVTLIGLRSSHVVVLQRSRDHGRRRHMEKTRKRYPESAIGNQAWFSFPQNSKFFHSLHYINF